MTKKAISFPEFSEMIQEKKLEILQRDGVYVGKRTVNGQKAILYQLYGFYVEVFFLDYRKKVERIITSQKTEILQPYIDQVLIRDLDKNKK